MKKPRKRKEADALGVRKIPADSYGGIFWSRATENFHVSNRRLPFSFYQNLALLKEVAVHEHVRAGRIDSKKGKAIAQACHKIMGGKFFAELDLDVFQAGAGTPLNMTLNEIIANRALEILREKKGKYSIIHPNTHVNMMQSTNDVIPTAMRLTAVDFSHALEQELVKTIRVGEELSKKYAKTLKVGRTHLQAAVPVTFGQELYVYTESLREALKLIRLSREGLYELSLGGTAVGTGITTEPGYDVHVISLLRKKKNVPYYPSHRKMLHTSHLSAFSRYSFSLSSLADELLIWANDWILLSSDSLTGIGEISLPPVEPGSSIMPGKINPSILEALKMICLQVQGNHETVRLAHESTQLELNVMTPVLASNLFESQQILTTGLKMFREKCLAHAQPNPRMKKILEQSLATATILNPYFGYDVVAHLVNRSLSTQESLEHVIEKLDLLSHEETQRILDSSMLTSPQKIDFSLKNNIQSRKSFISLKSRVQKWAQ